MNDSTEKTPPGMGVFLGLMAIISVMLLLLIPVQTEPAPAGQGWWTQPAFMPTVSLVIFAITAVYLFAHHLWSIRPNGEEGNDWSAVKAELYQWLLPLEYFVYYVIYIYVLGLVGYFLSSVLFAAGLSLRVRLHGRRWMLASFMFVLVMTALFRWGLKIWFPIPALFELFPPGVRIFLARNF